MTRSITSAALAPTGSTPSGKPQPDPTDARVSLLGGPNSGKSTYLGCLLDALEAQRIEALRLDKMPADSSALRRLTNPLLDGRYPQRTEFGNATPLAVQLRTVTAPKSDSTASASRHADTSGRHLPEQTFQLQVADYSGEELTALFDDRDGWSDAWHERAGAQGVLLFVRPAVLSTLPQLTVKATPDEVERWRQLQTGASTEHTSRAGEPIPRMSAPPPSLPSEAEASPILLPDDAVRVPTVLALIELLQFVRHARGLQPGQKPRPGSFRISILVSAWDAIPREWRQHGPARFISHHLPLLEDFLWCNFHPEDIFRFGLSATGGDLSDPKWSRTYQDDPQGYVEWVGLEGKLLRDEDIALPLYWTLFGEAAWKH